MSGALESSLIRSGPFFRDMRRSKLIRNDRSDLVRQTLSLVAITWGPIVVLELLRAAMHGGGLGILRSLSMHTRFLVTTFSDDFSVIVIFGKIVAFAPFASFSSSLLHARLEGLIAYGQLGLRYTRAFARRWVETPNNDGLLGTSDIQSLADLANSFGVVESMRLVPFGPRHVVVVFVAMAAPMLPLVLTEVPVHSLLQSAGRTLLGGLPP